MRATHELPTCWRLAQLRGMEPHPPERSDSIVTNTKAFGLEIATLSRPRPGENWLSRSTDFTTRMRSAPEDDKFADTKIHHGRGKDQKEADHSTADVAVKKSAAATRPNRPDRTRHCGPPWPRPHRRHICKTAPMGGGCPADETPSKPSQDRPRGQRSSLVGWSGASAGKQAPTMAHAPGESSDKLVTQEPEEAPVRPQILTAGAPSPPVRRFVDSEFWGIPLRRAAEFSPHFSRIASRGAAKWHCLQGARRIPG